jgi:DNA-binding Lrp family transcriptional regulator
MNLRKAREFRGADTRRRAILELLAVQGHVKVDALSKNFAVSGMTIRKDLTELEGQGLLQRTLGGAALSHHSRFHAPIPETRYGRGEQKRAIAQAAVKRVGSYLNFQPWGTSIPQGPVITAEPYSAPEPGDQYRCGKLRFATLLSPAVRDVYWNSKPGSQPEGDQAKFT